MSDENNSYLDRATFMQTLKSQRLLAQEKFNRDCKFGYNGGWFTASLSLLAEIKAASKNGIKYLIDDNGKPVKIEYEGSFREKVDTIFCDAIGDLDITYRYIAKCRSVGKLLDE